MAEVSNYRSDTRLSVSSPSDGSFKEELARERQDFQTILRNVLLQVDKGSAKALNEYSWARESFDDLTYEAERVSWDELLPYFLSFTPPMYYAFAMVQPTAAGENLRRFMIKRSKEFTSRVRLSVYTSSFDESWMAVVQSISSFLFCSAPSDLESTVKGNVVTEVAGQLLNAILQKQLESATQGLTSTSHAFEAAVVKLNKACAGTSATFKWDDLSTYFDDWNQEHYAKFDSHSDTQMKQTLTESYDIGKDLLAA